MLALVGADDGGSPENETNPSGGKVYLIARTAMPMEYVEQRNGGYYVHGTRVSLDSVVYAFLRGESPEGITDSFPALSLEQVYGAIAFYLAHRQSIDGYLQAGKAEFARLRDEARRRSPQLYAKLDAARERTPTSR